VPEPDTGWGVRDVTVRFGSRVVLDAVSLQVGPGQLVAVVGGDGAGKSTLLRALTGRVLPDQGEVLTPGREHLGYQPSTSGTWAQLSVDENLDLVASAYELEPAAERVRRDLLLDAAGLLPARSRLASQLSGGMRRKLGFCMAILHEPALLVLDEPSTGVDPVSRVELWGLITDAAANGTAVVLATTYLDEAERVHDVLVLDEGVALLRGTPAQVVASAPGTVTRVPEASDPVRAWRRGREVRQWHSGPPHTGDDVVIPDLEDAVVAAALQRRGENGPAAVRRPAARHAVADGAMSTARRVTRRFGSTTAVQQASLSVSPSEIVGLIGANGAGKTTLIRMLLGVLAPSEGEVQLFGCRPSRQSRRLLGYVSQGLGLYRDLTVAENLAFVASAYGISASSPVGTLASVADDLVGDIGLGQQRQLAFACALSHGPDLLVLDEPTSGVDPISRARLWDTIHEQAESGVGLLVSTHYMQEAEQCDRLVLMNLGQVVADGSVRDIIGDTTAVQIDTDHWAEAFAALRAHQLPVALSGTHVRVADTDPGSVAAILADAQVTARVDVVPATLEEKMTAITRAGQGAGAR
jgi:ABC-2 type transport system ATP-binding protein